ncbi:sugar porter family MFS transporter [Salipaludibacillus daqingensis]|uniref:sugar porter family MFS transporter n=1 Tax=Salipaludibacillus daqingensis TaxID=3041001 RepID=UPI0024757E9C|nr:sugar porter family MFS transporter [Salipaludibacillus daqingensis]
MNNKNSYPILIAMVASIGGILFGYDTAVIAGAIGSLQVYFDLSPAMVGWAVSSALLGCLIAALLAAKVADNFGRKKTLMIAGVLFGVSAILSAIPPNFAFFILARMIGGIGIGLASIVVPMYISEISPKKNRGVLTSFYQVAITLGILIIYFVNFRVSESGNAAWNVEMGWRIMLGSEVIPAIIFIVLLFFIPETPRWLVLNGDLLRGQEVLKKIGSTESESKEKVKEIQSTIQLDKENKKYKLFSKTWKPALFVGVGLAILQQASGINVIMYYATEIFNEFQIGGTENAGFYQSVLIGLVNFLATFIAIIFIDRVGRKPILIFGSIGMAISMSAVGLMIYMQIINFFILILVFMYIIFFAFSWGPIAWILISEIFPNKLRAKVMSISVFVLWFSNIVVAQTFPMINDNATLQSVFNGAFPFLVYGLFCLIAIPFSIYYVPETKNKSLEEIEEQWKTQTT